VRGKLKRRLQGKSVLHYFSIIYLLETVIPSNCGPGLDFFSKKPKLKLKFLEIIPIKKV